MSKFIPHKDFWKSRGIPDPVVEYKFHRGRRWRFDYAWPKEWVAVEVEGATWAMGRHNRGAGMRGDMEKYNEATLLGWQLLRFPTDLMQSETTAAQIRKLIVNNYKVKI